MKRLQGKIAVVFQNAYTANSGKPTKKAIYQQAGIVPELVFKLGRWIPIGRVLANKCFKWLTQLQQDS